MRYLYQSRKCDELIRFYLCLSFISSNPVILYVCIFSLNLIIRSNIDTSSNKKGFHMKGIFFLLKMKSMYFSSCKVQAIQISSKIFFRIFLHNLIERELLITNIYFLALANASFRSKNTKHSKGVVFREKHNFF